jgi:hypothetical protein
LCLAACLVTALLAFSPAAAGAPHYEWNEQGPGVPGSAFTAVYAADANHAWAVGLNGRIATFDGITWNLVVPPLTTNSLYGIDGTDANNVWVVGSNGLVLYFNGTTWTSQSAAGAHLYDVTALAPNDVWAVGAAGTIRHFDGTVWGPPIAPAPTGFDLSGVSFLNANDGWAVAPGGTILHFNGTTWTSQSAAGANLYNVTALAPNNVWAVGEAGTIRHFDGTVWSPPIAPAPTAHALYGISALDANNIWAVGVTGVIVFYDGTAWSAQTGPGSAQLDSVFALDAGHVWAVGSKPSATSAQVLIAEPTTYPDWYLAEGSTNWGYDCYITIENPGAAPTTASVTYMTTTGQVVAPDVALAAYSQAIVNPRDVLGSNDFSTKVSSKDGATIAVDRTMTWTGTGAASPERHNSVGVTYPSGTWYLPEGSSNWGFECFLLIQNPNAVEATCLVTYMIENEVPQVFTKTVPANSRRTYNISEDIGAKDTSIKVTSNERIIPERAMYRNNRREGHDSIGTIAANITYNLAEGTSAWGFTTFVLVQNPNPVAANVAVTYMTDTGAMPPVLFPVPANSRETINVNATMPGRDFSTNVTADVPIIAERAMYWDYGKGEACHDSIGMAAAHTFFYLPDGQADDLVANPDGVETWTLVQNPNPNPVNIIIGYLSPTGVGNVVVSDTIPANTRRTYNIGANYQGRGAVKVRVTTAGSAVMVERAMYSNARGAGTDTIGGYSDTGP